MQGWHDQGFFSAKLLMKRTNIDSDFVSLQQLAAWSTGEKLFLSPLALPTPPGLLDHDLNGPYQPAPMRSSRHNALDAFGTNSNPSDSPGSSFGARGYTASPDAAAFGGRASSGLSGGDHSLNGHAYGSTTDAFGGPRKSSYGPGYEAGFHSSPQPAPTSFQSSPWNVPSSTPFVGNTGDHTATPTFPHQAGAGFGPGHAAGYPNPDPPFAPQGNVFNQPVYNSGVPSPSPIANSSPSISHPLPGGPPYTAQPQAQWERGSEASSTRPLHPFAPPHPTAYNAQPVQPSQQSTWDTAHRRSSIAPTNETAPWPPSSKNIIDQDWTQDHNRPSSLTVDNLGQHNLHHQQELQVDPPVGDSPAPIPEKPLPITSSPAMALPPVQVAPITVTPLPTSKSKSKKNKEKAPSPSRITFVPAPPQDLRLTESPPPASVSKTPWGKDEDVKKPVTLREIQDAEKKAEDKRVQARKAADKERAARAPPSDGEDSFTLTKAWGLPTSQAGARPPAATKEAPVWTGASSTLAPKTPKKSMKEIQEEEEKRKKTAAKETVASIASRRATESAKVCLVPCRARVLF